ncbi:Phospholipid--sterol O-acyltransferase [Balamuthia mandrillaris]
MERLWREAVPRPHTDAEREKAAAASTCEEDSELHAVLDRLKRQYKHRAVLMIPGFASSQLYNWKYFKCYGVSDWALGDRLWLDVRKLVAAPECWLTCMTLNADDQSDGPECKVRPGEGLSAIAQLDHGFITGAFSTIWRQLIEHMVAELGYDPGTTVNAAPYDFRLPPSVMDARDNFFSDMMVKIESLVKAQERGIQPQSSPGVIIIAHSLGNNVFRYFLEWLKKEKGEFNYQSWIDRHISDYIAIGAPLLGSPSGVEAVLSGVTFGLPRIRPDQIRVVGNTFGSTPWMLPFGAREGEDGELEELWGMEVASIIEPSAEPEKGFGGGSVSAAGNLGPGSTPLDLALMKRKDSEKRKYNASNILELFEDIKEWDPISGKIADMAKKWYVNDPVLNPFTPWERPPIARVYCIYGINLRTQLSYTWEKGAVNGTWNMVEVVYEEGDQVYSENVKTGRKTYLNKEEARRAKGYKKRNKGEAKFDYTDAEREGKSGDETVPYTSLSYCHNWLSQDPSKIKITRIPQRFYFDEQSKQLEGDESLGITFYESLDTAYDGWKQRKWATAVWEMDLVNHRDAVRSNLLFREITEEVTFHMRTAFEEAVRRHYQEKGSMEKDSDWPFAPKNARVPRKDDDCVWDYWNHHCKYPQFCEYRYAFGDLTLDQSCRLKLHDEFDISLSSSKRSTALPQQESTVTVETTQLSNNNERQEIIATVNEEVARTQDLTTQLVQTLASLVPIASSSSSYSEDDEEMKEQEELEERDNKEKGGLKKKCERHNEATVCATTRRTITKVKDTNVTPIASIFDSDRSASLVYCSPSHYCSYASSSLSFSDHSSVADVASSSSSSLSLSSPSSSSSSSSSSEPHQEADQASEANTEESDLGQEQEEEERDTVLFLPPTLSF